MKPQRYTQNQFPRLDKDSFNNLTDADIDELYLAWERHGAKVLKTVVEKRPDVFIKVVASLII